MAVMRTIKIDGVEFQHPKDFAMSAVPNIVSSLVTMSGESLADVNGWVYEPVTLEWDWIDADEIVQLLNATDPMNGAFEFTFDDMISGQQKTINAIRTGVGGTKIPTITPDGKVQWSGIQISFSFPDCYH